MSKQTPPDDELWMSAGPLQPPSEAAAARAKPIFDRWLHEMRDVAPRPAGTVAAGTGGGMRLHVGGGRRYDLALTIALGAPAARQLLESAAQASLAAASPPAPEPAPRAGPPSIPPPGRAPWQPAVRAPVRAQKVGLLPLEDDPTTVSSDDNALEPTVIHALPDDTTHTAVRVPPNRPPPGAPVVRAPLKTGHKATAVDQEVWQQTADTALLRTEADGGMAFDIVIRDDVFADLSCTIAVHEGRATATFRVSDANTRRLLEGEAGRLRAALEGRGLRVDAVHVVVEAR